MKTNALFTLLVSLLPALSMAQVQSMDVSSELESELNNLNSRQARAERSAPVINNNLVVRTRNANTNTNANLQELPTTLVEASPLTESRADKLRKQREASELNTEMLIVEQLEQDRIRAERERAQKLFGNKLQQEEPQQVVAPVVVEEPVQNTEDLKEELSEIKAILNEKTVEQPVEAAEVTQTYAYEPEVVKDDSQFTMSVMAGAGSYPGVDNVDGVYALGFGVGMEFGEGLSVEAGYTNSEYDVFSLYTGAPIELTQHEISATLKYRLLNSRVSPVVGGLASYTMRNYQRKYNDYYSYGSDKAESQSLDLGLLIGADIEVTRKFSVSLDLKYIFNITNRVDNENNYNNGYYNNNYYNNYGYGYNSQYDYNTGGTPVEELERMVIGVNAVLKF